MKDIKVTIDDGEQKAIIEIKDGGNDDINIEANFDPPATKESKSPVVAVAMRFLQSIK